MNKKHIIGFFVLIIFIAAGCLNGCQPNSDSDDSNYSDPRDPMPHLAFKGDRTTFSINDITLTFYCGSENAGGSSIYGYKDYPVVTYIYFANAKTYARRNVVNNEITFDFVEEFAPKQLYNIIEKNENFSVCKKIFSNDPDAFYKNNTVTRQYLDVPYKENTYAAEDAWGKGSALYKASLSYTKGVFIPDVSYNFTIPQAFFTENEGYLFFGVASYLSEDYEALSGLSGKEGGLLEHRTITLYYTRNGSDITLSRYYSK